MKKLLKDKKFWIIVGIMILSTVGGIGLYFYRANFDKEEAKETESSENDGKYNEDTSTEKTDNPGSDNDYQSLGGETPTVQSNIGELKEVSLTVYVLTEDTVSQDGKTTIKAGSITPYFYMPSGVYSIQKLSGGVWVDVATNIQYPGHGGLSAGYTTSTEDNISYRVLKIEENTVKLISKTFVVKRAEIEGNTKTYN